ncbi:SLC13 family permease [Agromyces sp. MMS24-K17]|uniref:SLC13 family permease n=1 Tax=Agromyces sp. MMS24-K17 TaxID=3372850 RepID=UPI003754D63A
MRLVLIGTGLLAAGLAAFLAGVVSPDDLAALLARIGPVLGFVVGITIVAELAADAGLFRWIAERLAVVARGRGWLLWIAVVLLAVASTVFLSLDTTAVLLTPVVITLAQHVRVSPIPFALTTIWLANTASLLLPVSNLTNLLAAQAMDRTDPAAFATLTWAPAIAAIVVPVVLLFLLRRREILARYEPDAPTRVEDRPLFVVAGVVVLLLLPALVSGVEVWIPAAIAAAVLLVAFAVRGHRLSWRLVPWPPLVFALGLFVAVDAAHAAGWTAWLGPLVGPGVDGGFAGLLQAAGVGAASANAIDNLPAYLLLEPYAHDPVSLVAVLIGVNAGVLVTPWASLATLLWHSRLVSMGVSISWPKFALAGLVAAPLTVVAATAALWAVHG